MPRKMQPIGDICYHIAGAFARRQRQFACSVKTAVRRFASRLFRARTHRFRIARLAGDLRSFDDRPCNFRLFQVEGSRPWRVICTGVRPKARLGRPGSGRCKRARTPGPLSVAFGAIDAAWESPTVDTRRLRNWRLSSREPHSISDSRSSMPLRVVSS
jgi:hypothetical protein